MGKAKSSSWIFQTPDLTPTQTDNIDFEKEFRIMNINLYKLFTKYILPGLMAIMCSEMLRSFFAGEVKTTFAFICIFISTIIGLKWIWSRDAAFETGITVSYLFVHNFGSIINYVNKHHFVDAYDAYIFGYTFSMIERLMIEGMSNIKHRVLFSGFTLLVRTIFLPPYGLGNYLKHAWVVFLIIAVEIIREKCNKDFFFSYLNSKDQLAKFKNLVEVYIPDAIAIVSQDLTKSFFANKSYKDLVKNIQPDLEGQLNSFKLKNDLTASAANLIKLKTEKTLLDFARNTSIVDGASCIVTFNKGESTSLKEIEEQETQTLFKVRLSKIVWDDQPSIAIILHDLTEHHTLLSLKIADAQKDKILATVSHELKTPLNGMLGMIQIMEKKIRETELLKFLTICKSSTTLLVSLVRSILDLNHLREHKLELNVRSINIRELLKEILCLFEYQCHQKGIYLRTRIGPGTPSHVLTDNDRLSQVLIHLVANAHKFTSNGGITLNVDKAKEIGSVMFTVEDTGIGISKSDQKRLFQIYGKLSHEDERIHRQGVGLGLTIAESLVKALNSNEKKEAREITVQSELGKGSNFSFTIRSAQPGQRKVSYMFQEDESAYLPTIPDEINESRDIIEPYSTSHREHLMSTSSKYNTSFHRRTMSEKVLKQAFTFRQREAYILLVDDNLFNLTVAEHLVLNNGYKSKTALSGADAIKIVCQTNHTVDQIILILMDCQMPVMDGYQATRELRKLIQEGKAPMIPIVALTANDSQEDKAACKKSGMCDHLSKPLKDEELRRILKKYC